jgi:hypothetical protein
MLRVYQLASLPGRLRLWIGTSDLYAAQERRPVIFVEGRPVATMRVDGDGPELDSPRIEMASGGTVQPVANLACGVYEVDGNFPSGRTARVTVTLGEQNDFVDAQVLPAEIGSEPLNVLVASCYFHPEFLAADFARALDAVGDGAKEGKGRGRIDLVLLLGDQVYLDVPLRRQNAHDREALAIEFGKKYAANWFSPPGRSGLQSLMKLGPVLFGGDDHELWNNAPYLCAWVAAVHSERGQANWRAAALGLFRAFQAGGLWPGDGDPSGSAEVQRWRCLDVAPFSFFFCDAIWQRQHEQLLAADTRWALSQWVARLNQKKWSGVFCSGVSLLERKNGSRTKAQLIDAVPADFGDGAEILRILASVHAPQSLLLLGGDFHFGRICAAGRTPYLGDVVELLSSPVALVASPWDAVTRIGGLWSKWPRHSEPGFDLGWVPGRSSPVPPKKERKRLGKRGDHLCLLKLYKDGKAQARFFGLRDDASDDPPSRAIELFPAFGEARNW